MVIVFALMFSSLNPWNPLNYFGRPWRTIDTSRSAVIKEIQSLNRLETASYTVEKIIEAGTNGNAFQNILFGDRLLLIAHGKVVAGVDLSRISDEDVRVDGDTLNLHLPNTEVFSATLDNDQTKVYDRDQGLLARGDTDLETQARQAAESSIRQAACDSGILSEAATNARLQLQQMYALAGFEHIEVTITAGICR